jgi:hypothetical protein
MSPLPHTALREPIAGHGDYFGRATERSNEFRNSLHDHTLPIVTRQRKQEITPGNVTFGNIRSMEITNWSELENQWERLKWARLRWQAKLGVSDNASAAAESLGIKPGTYRAYERPAGGEQKNIALSFEHAQKIARKFGVSWVWLLSGEGAPYEAPATEPILRINNTVRSLDLQQQIAVAEIVERLYPRSGTHN